MTTSFNVWDGTKCGRRSDMSIGRDWRRSILDKKLWERPRVCKILLFPFIFVVIEYIKKYWAKEMFVFKQIHAIRLISLFIVIDLWCSTLLVSCAILFCFLWQEPQSVFRATGCTWEVGVAKRRKKSSSFQLLSFLISNLSQMFCITIHRTVFTGLHDSTTALHLGWALVHRPVAFMSHLTLECFRVQTSSRLTP